MNGLGPDLAHASPHLVVPFLFAGGCAEAGRGSVFRQCDRGQRSVELEQCDCGRGRLPHPHSKENALGR